MPVCQKCGLDGADHLFRNRGNNVTRQHGQPTRHCLSCRDAFNAKYTDIRRKQSLRNGRVPLQDHRGKAVITTPWREAPAWHERWHAETGIPVPNPDEIRYNVSHWPHRKR